MAILRFQPAACLAASALVTAASLTLLGGCAQQQTRDTAAVAPSPWALPTSTMRWNEYACELIARSQAGQVPAARTLAYLNLGINNAIVEAKQQRRKPEGAAAGAGATVLAHFFPKDEASIAARLNGEIAAMGAGALRDEFAAGANIGRTVGASVVALAKSDRSDLAWSGALPTGADKWSSRAQPARPPLGPRLGEMRPFFIASGDAFRVRPPPDVASPEFRATLGEVRAISDRRTNEQIRIAQYWENLTGAFSAGLWNDVARGAISAHGMDEAQSARVLAMVHMVAIDAVIASHDSKYVYWVPRPTQLDPQISLAIGVPNHPSYPSNHAAISGAVGLVMDYLFPDDKGRYFAMGLQAGESRVYAGIHYRIDLDEGYAIARKVAARAIEVGVSADRPFVPQGR